MPNRRRLASAPGFVVATYTFFGDVRGILMDAGLAGESLGFWKGVIATLSVVWVLVMLWPETSRIARALAWSLKPRSVIVRFRHGEKWRETQCKLGKGLVHHLQFEDQGLENVIEIDKAYRIVFTDPQTGMHWGEMTEGDIRRYKSGPFASSCGFRDVFVMIERQV